VAAQALLLLTQLELRSSQDAAAAGRADEALASALRARALAPWTASPHLQLALVRERAGELGAARTAIRAAIERDRADWRLWLVAARLETKAGDAARAREALQRARELNPRSQLLVPK
jgi:tetratricopeptide (TPR) repeat protein